MWIEPVPFAHFRFACLMVLLLVTQITLGAVRLPLDGYFRPGQCMPVLIEANHTGLTIRADGIVPTEVAAGRNGIVPVLVPGSSAGTIEGTALRPLGPNERLVGFTAEPFELARELFPGATIIPVRLDPSRPLPGPALAWEALDAVILDSAPDPAQLPDLLATGIDIAVRSDAAPDARWPWQRFGDAWVLRVESSGPDGVIAGPPAYLPAMSWQSGTPAALRRRIVLAGAVVALLVLSTLLIRSRAGIALTLLAAVLGCAAIEYWRRAQPEFRRADGNIIVARGALAVVDQWTYLSAVTDTRERSTSRPVLFDPAQAQRIQLALACEADGSMRWHCALPRGNRLALLARRVRVVVETAVLPDPAQSPLYDLARQLYLRSGDRIVGAVPAPVAPDERWMGILINDAAVDGQAQPFGSGTSLTAPRP
jgi:hypothetical protein